MLCVPGPVMPCSQDPTYGRHLVLSFTDLRAAFYLPGLLSTIPHASPGSFVGEKLVPVPRTQRESYRLRRR